MTNTMRRDGAARAARWLRLAAAPCFAMLALLAALRPEAPLDALCGGGDLDGMAAMYLLMSVFHLPAWLVALSPASPDGTAISG
ncbi:hypothetical protein [Roseomonas sp. AR75]|uniref:hypothetical protein n=1 Tax=Roseomonas sp. AR75 TaxID=2562311 RepID=UPI0010C037BA|nr:hypothetical protein [Roseomonas sp. AR75]